MYLKQIYSSFIDAGCQKSGVAMFANIRNIDITIGSPDNHCRFKINGGRLHIRPHWSLGTGSLAQKT